MSGVDYWLLRLFALLGLVVSAALIVPALGLLETQVYDALAFLYQSLPSKIALLVVALALLLLSLRFLVVRRRPRQETALAGRNAYGETRIALSTFEHLAAKAAQKIPGAHDVAVRFEPSEIDGYQFYIKIGVDGEAPIPELIERVQAEVKSKVEAITGVEISKVSVFVHEVERPEAPKPPRRRVL
ncbi:MAG: alkaline shock response membrane anchor protein AmaP [Hydrogenibacillus schlegelii]|nr:alkaline shock response membrane anchor protein AmaP [Hydrogenibacillus schlegelii]